MKNLSLFLVMSHTMNTQIAALHVKHNHQCGTWYKQFKIIHEHSSLLENTKQHQNNCLARDTQTFAD